MTIHHHSPARRAGDAGGRALPFSAGQAAWSGPFADRPPAQGARVRTARVDEARDGGVRAAVIAVTLTVASALALSPFFLPVIPG
ncbi:hypothetical protein ACFFJB_05895 [Camelimonas abortus]|uniref:Uncharacterized protein n=1 Tax=Camelimonas abortus TaxID=1017184 RepID=A0ABV7LD81_9HYPH